MQQFKITSTNPEEIEEIQKRLVNYAISLHIISKSLKSIDKLDEGKEFLDRSLHVAQNLLPTPNPKLVEKIKLDMNEFEKEIRSLPSKRETGDPDKLLDKLAALMNDKTTPGKSFRDNKSKQLDRSVSEK